ncbi:hypothetical protein ASPVEDRAFT_46411 [Aspergillus versicolor CBS 583.65]|uniref:COMPASS complex subunit Sdc1 n=1 Tax=Aspergillus versicolor CBS 583.65 TaxID=1036611 RepID=A0A1L9PZU0_ASPVE|nr:uncharacterized protein ASPVEDRAFT_46411 [Aspergillus versicolor CBS 583.65]OJJ07038.1 hypothetical protein ASPVEDRAFT_46411 [Aspergillus versicolor CBS 583.65]
MANDPSNLPPAGTETGAAGTPTADPMTSATNASPVRPGGAPARVYMNEKIVPYLLEGMKNVTKEQPANPLRVLGEYLIQKSNEVEGAQSGKAPE